MRFRFADCVLDMDSLRLTRGGEHVHVEPQVFDLLALLVQNAGSVVSKDQLIEEVWHGRIVSEATISARINAARTAVGDDGQKQAIIGTVPRRGLELRVPVEVEGSLAQNLDRPASSDRQKIRYAKSADGARIAFAESGSGPPLLRAGHHLTHLELDWNSPLWRPMWDRLGSEHTLFRYDVRGTGLSEHETEGTDIRHHVADMKAVADAAGLDQFPLLANLQSTPVALRFVAENPGRVTRLVIHQGYAKGRALRQGAPQDPDADPVIALMRNGWGDPDNGFMRAWVSMIIPDSSRDEVTALIKLLSSAVPKEYVVPSRRVLDRFSAEDVLDKIKIPTLVVHARNDTIHPVEEARELAMGIDGAELVIVESGHTVCLASDPTWEEQVGAIMQFLREGQD